MGFLTDLTDCVMDSRLKITWLPREESHTEMCVKSVKSVKNKKEGRRVGR